MAENRTKPKPLVALQAPAHISLTEGSQMSAPNISVCVGGGSTGRGKHRFTVVRMEKQYDNLNNNTRINSVFPTLTTINLLLFFPVYCSYRETLQTT